jgi:hypothetical protein
MKANEAKEVKKIVKKARRTKSEEEIRKEKREEKKIVKKARRTKSEKEIQKRKKKRKRATQREKIFNEGQIKIRNCSETNLRNARSGKPGLLLVLVVLGNIAGRRLRVGRRGLGRVRRRRRVLLVQPVARRAPAAVQRVAVVFVVVAVAVKVRLVDPHLRQVLRRVPSAT